MIGVEARSDDVGSVGRLRRLLSSIGVLLLALGAVLPAWADGPLFTAVTPGTEAGQWLVELETDGLRSPDQLSIRADGETVEAVPLEGAPAGRMRWRLEGIPAGTVNLEAAAGGKSARVGLAPMPPGGDWTIYHVMLGFFANGSPANDGEIEGWRHPAYAGGDLQGVLAKADYIASLGVDAVWLSPTFAARTSHGYDVTNYYRIGDAVAVPGDAAASTALFRQVVAALHERGVRVILDLPLNHAHRGYDREAGDPQGFKPRATPARQEAEKLWDSWDAGYRYWNFEHEPTRRFLEAVALHWLVEEGVDGLRLDYVRGVPHDFWAELYARVEEAKPGAFLVGECWIDGEGVAANAADIATYYRPVDGRPQFSSLLDFPMQILMTESFARGGSLRSVEQWIQGFEDLYGAGARPTFFLDNHDTSRFLAWAGNTDRLVAAVGFLATLSSPMVMFYGTETGLADGSPRPGFTDSGRIPMPWESLDRALVERVAGYLRARAAHPSLRTGGRRPLIVEEDLLVAVKDAEGETALVAVNLGTKERTVLVDAASVSSSRGMVAPHLVLGAPPPDAMEGGVALSWRLPPLTTAVAVFKGPAGSARDAASSSPATVEPEAGEPHPSSEATPATAQETAHGAAAVAAGGDRGKV